MMVRQAEAADAEAIARIYVDSWRDSYAGLVPDHVLLALSRRRQAVQWRRQIAYHSGGQHTLVAEGADGVVGFGSCGRARDPALTYGGEVFTLYVDADHRGHGHGGALLRALFAALAQDGRTSALVWVLARNPARFFYEALGGRRVATRDERLWGAVVPQWAYGWDDLATVAAGGARHPASRRD